MADIRLDPGVPYDLEITGGLSLELECEYTNEDGTPVLLEETDVIAGKFARYAGSRILASFTTEITDGPAGKFVLRLSGTESAKLVNNAEYQVVLNPGPDAEGLFGGRVKFHRGVV